ncbi:MAG: hypothetical protein A3F16_08005 [Deltaproteobacteria bacterium RIFCSPHIGHO2_12_FULL_43_9]|nr:MAG: hypothetical protein A3F16_08005 [Deltaproteobacteria bacterium RIFCSPHIGHO2_12_FULL_43_9]
MQNIKLASDYIERSKKRLVALRTLFEEEAWADVVREAQEIVELTLKALLRVSGIEVPRIHDVSDILRQEASLLPKEVIGKNLETLMEISHSLRRDRELAFYGSEELTPSSFYRKKDAEDALNKATNVVEIVAPHIK